MLKPFKVPWSARRLFLGLVLMASLLVVLVTAWALLYSRSQIERGLERNTVNLANTLALTFESKIDTIDVMLQSCADEISQRIAKGQTDPAQISAYLERQMSHLPSIILRASNAGGDVIYVPGPVSSPSNIVDREYYTHLRDNPDAGLFVSKPVVGKINGKWIWLFARRISSVDKKFAGVVFARIDVENIDQLLAQIRLEPGSSISLRDAGLGLIAGRMASRQTYPVAIGDTRVTDDFRDAIHKNPLEGSYKTHVSVMDAQARTFSFKANLNYGFYVNVGSTGEVAFDEWRKQAWITGSLASLFVVLMLGFSTLISVAWRRQDQGVQALKQAQEIANLGNFRYDLRTRRFTSSVQMQRIFGIAVAHVQDHAIWLQTLVQPSAEVLLAQCQKAMAEHRSFDYEFSIRRGPDAELRWLQCFAIVEFDEAANAKAVAGTVQDITERKIAQDTVKEFNETLETRIAQRTQELEQAMRTLQGFQEELTKSEARATISMLVASVSHELSTPIGNGVMVATTLKDQARSLKRQIDAGSIKRSDFSDFLLTLDDGTAMIESNLQRAESLLQTFRQVSADQASEQRRKFDLRQVLLEVLKTLEPSIKRKPQRVVLQVPAGIEMDSLPGPIGQVAINLINNAYLHAFEGRSEGLLELDARVDGDQVTLSFTDNGAGMAPDQLAHLFEPFFSTKIGRGGTGLGMAIVDNLVSKSLAGRISVHSTPGQGSRFDITLPLVLPSVS